ncbi:MAG: hypothetical protein AB1394_06645 [Bacteroidota bacterium]
MNKLKAKITVKKKKVRIPLPKQTPKVKTSDKIYKRSQNKKMDLE